MKQNASVQWNFGWVTLPGWGRNKQKDHATVKIEFLRWASGAHVVMSNFQRDCTCFIDNEFLRVEKTKIFITYKYVFWYELLIILSCRYKCMSSIYIWDHDTCSSILIFFVFERGASIRKLFLQYVQAYVMISLWVILGICTYWLFRLLLDVSCENKGWDSLHAR